MSILVSPICDSTNMHSSYFHSKWSICPHINGDHCNDIFRASRNDCIYSCSLILLAYFLSVNIGIIRNHALLVIQQMTSHYWYVFCWETGFMVGGRYIIHWDVEDSISAWRFSLVSHQSVASCGTINQPYLSNDSWNLLNWIRTGLSLF